MHVEALASMLDYSPSAIRQAGGAARMAWSSTFKRANGAAVKFSPQYTP